MALALRQIQSREDQPAFRFSDGAQILAGISQHQNAGHALWILGGKVADDANDDVGFILTIRTIDSDQTAFESQDHARQNRRREIPPAYVPERA